MRPVSRVSFLPPHITSWLCISNIWLAALSHAGSPIAASFPSDRAGAPHSAPDAKRPPFGGRPHYLRRPSFAISSLRSEEHTSELQSLMRISYAVFCLKKKKHTNAIHQR